MCHHVSNANFHRRFSREIREAARRDKGHGVDMDWANPGKHLRCHADKPQGAKRPLPCPGATCRREDSDFHQLFAQIAHFQPTIRYPHNSSNVWNSSQLIFLIFSNYYSLFQELQATRVSRAEAKNEVTESTEI